MRGNVHYSKDGGRSWQAASVQAPVSTYGHAVADDGRLLLAGQGGILLASQDQGHSFKVIRKEGRASLTGIYRLADGSWLLTSDGGLQRHQPATRTADATRGSAAADHHRSLLMTHHAMTRNRRPGGLPGPHADRLAAGPSVPSSCCSPWAWATRPSTPGSTPASTS
jgi:hypothetical protein